MKNAEEKLNEDIESLYDIFSSYKRPGHLVEYREEDPGGILSRKPLREFTTEEIAAISTKSFCFPDNDIKQSLKHWLPRVLEAMSLDSSQKLLGVEFWWVGERLSETNWYNWEKREVYAIDMWHRDWWHAIIAYPHIHENACSTVATDGGWYPDYRNPEVWLNFSIGANIDPTITFEQFKLFTCDSFYRSIIKAAHYIDALLQEGGGKKNKNLLSPAVDWFYIRTNG